MGTRADFYVGCGVTAKWLGSVAWDGYEWAETPGSDLVLAKSEDDFRDAVSGILSGPRKDATLPKQGWPWPWPTSATTDYVYWWDGKKTQWATFDDEHEWPNMTDIQRVTMGKRSGVIVIGGADRG